MNRYRIIIQATIHNDANSAGIKSIDAMRETLKKGIQSSYSYDNSKAKY